MTMVESNTLDRSDIIRKALEEIRRLKKTIALNQNSIFEPIAVVGMACRFPKGVNTPSKFWKALKEQDDLIGPIPKKRVNHTVNEAWKNSPFLKEAGYIEDDIEGFDHRLFRFSPREAERTDPQQRLFLKVCWEALENAGYAPDSLRGSKTGVYAGVMMMEYMQQLANERSKTAKLDPYDVSGNGFSFLSGRASYFFGFQGPGITTDTACSSSLVSIDQACKGLWLGDCSMALAGGVNLLLFQESTALFSSLNILSPDCRSKSFDADANGTVRGEGCGVVVLKKISDAVRDGDHIHAVIKASGVNQSGLASGPTVPHGPSQEKLLKDVWNKAGISTTGPDYIEAHGTGTEIGDPIEMNSIIHLLPKERQTPVYIGTVKSNLGHLEAAAGVAGFIKTVLALENKQLPGNLHFNTPSSHINWSDSCIEIPRQTIPWEKSQKPRTAGISSFGLSGTNAHIVLEEYETPIVNLDEQLHNTSRKWPLRFSARSLSCIKDQYSIFSTFLKESETLNFHELSYSQNISRADFKERQVIWASNKEEAICILEAALANESDDVPIEGLWKKNSLPKTSLPDEKNLEEISFSETVTNQELEHYVFANWIKEGKTDWKSYYKESGLKKINVPNYQFREKIFGLEFNKPQLNESILT